MLSLEATVRELDAYLGMQARPQERVIAFRDTLAECVTHSNDTLLRFLEQKETNDWEETARCFLLSTPEHILLREAGNGSFGVVYKAFDVHEEQYRALKFLEPTKIGKVKDAYTLFGQDGLNGNERLADKFRHENIVKYYGRIDDHTLVFEWIEGDTLDKIEHFSSKEIDDIIIQICRGVGHMHANGYAYNDLRFPNIMRNNKRKKQVITLLDYSIATPLDEKGVSVHHGNLSSREIAAPESILRNELSVRTDIWAIGHLMYRLFTKEHAFPHQHKDQLESIVQTEQSYVLLRQRVEQDEQIPQKYKPIILKCLSYNPDHRYQSVEELLTVIDPPKTLINRWSVGAAAIGCVSALICGAIGIAGLTYGVFFSKTIIQKENVYLNDPTNPPEYSENRKVKRTPRIPPGKDPTEICKNPTLSGLVPSRYDNKQEFEFCLDFRHAEALLDTADFIGAARQLEQLEKKYPKSHEIPAALMEAYYELGIIKNAERMRERVIQEFGVYNPIELAVYGTKIQFELYKYPTSLMLHKEICTLGAVTKEFPECPEFDLTARLGIGQEEQKMTAYKKLQKKYPHSFVLPREYARLQLQILRASYDPSSTKELDSQDITKINDALHAYEQAAHNAQEKSAFFSEISSFFEHSVVSYAHAFVFAYRAEQTAVKEHDIISFGTESERLYMQYVQLKEDSTLSKQASRQLNKQEIATAYERLSMACTQDKEFFICACEPLP